MIIAILIYLIYVIPLGIRNYFKNENIPTFVKFSNIIVTFLIFQYYIGDFRHILWDLFENGIGAFYSTQENTSYTKGFDLLSSIIYFIVSLYVAGLVLNLAAKVKSRRLFLFSSPIIVVVTSIDLAKLLVAEYDLGEEFIFSILLAFVFLSIIFGLINIFYFFNPGKKLFIYSRT